MKTHACGNPVSRYLVTRFIGNVDSEMLQRVEPALQEANGMLRTNAEDGDMVVEALVLRKKAFRFLIWCSEPVIDLRRIQNIVEGIKLDE